MTQNNLNEIPVVLQDTNTATDLDSSLRFRNAAQVNLRFCEELGWLAWDGKRWATGMDHLAMQTAKSVARQWVQEAQESGIDALVKTARTLENAGRLRSAVQLAEADPVLRVDPKQLDCDPWLLNVENGTLDLKTGELRAHCKTDMITKLAPVRYVAGAQHPVLEKYLDHIRQTTPEMEPFLARCFGAALSGDATVESLFVLEGEGGSGKTTLVEAVARMLGDYSAKLRFESFCVSKQARSGGSATPDLIPLRGARLGYASEGDQSAKLDAGMVKQLTGDEPIPVRMLYKEAFTIDSTWKLWLVTNFPPGIDAEDSGMWRRVFRINFKPIPVEERDPTLKHTLVNDLAARSALLAWCLAGCLKWRHNGGGRKGLDAPSSVVAATSEYRSKQDILGEWWTDLVGDEASLNPDSFTSSTVIRQHYDKWCDEQGASRVLAKRFWAYLASKGLKRERVNGVRGWKGIRLGGFVSIVCSGARRPLLGGASPNYAA